jgi:DNA-binding Lrp family transcriptional regulator
MLLLMPTPSNSLRPATAPPRLDRIDRALLAALQNDARQSNKELAASVGLAPSSCLERVRRLRAAGVLRGARAEVDPEALGIELEALIAVQLRQHARAEVEAFRAHALSLPQVVGVFHVAGEHDFLVHVAVPSAEALRGLALDAFTSRPEVSRLHTWLIFEATRAPKLPDYLAEPEPPRASPRRARARRPGAAPARPRRRSSR